jgi:hypothetical protein
MRKVLESSALITLDLASGYTPKPFTNSITQVPINGMSRSLKRRETVPMKKRAQHLIAEVPRRQAKVEITIGIDLGDVWIHYCTLNQDG